MLNRAKLSVNPIQYRAGHTVTPKQLGGARRSKRYRMSRQSISIDSEPFDSLSTCVRYTYKDYEKYQDVTSCDYAMFFDRGVLDALYMLDVENALTRDEIAKYVQKFPYNSVVFLLPPWKEIYDTDSERDQTFEKSVEVFEGLKKWYLKWGYEILEVPRGNINERVSFILQHIDAL